MFDLDQSHPSTDHARNEIDRADLLQAIEEAASAIPPLWTLRNFVAVNPFLGFTGLPFQRGLAEIDRIHHARGTLSLELYRAARDAGRISDGDLEAAIEAAPRVLGRSDLENGSAAALRDRLMSPRESAASADRMLTYAEALDRADGCSWSPMIAEQISAFCAGRFDAGQSSWHQPWSELPLYAAWRAQARWNRDPELRGLSGFRETVRGLPEDPIEAIQTVLRQLEVPAREQTAWMARALASIGGWAGHVQYRVREAKMAGREPETSLADLLAIRAAWDGALHRHTAARRHPSAWPALSAHAHRAARSIEELHVEREGAPKLSELEMRILWQVAYENGFRRELLSKIAAPHAAGAATTGTPLVQAAFCIDVRSERLRRHLEASSSDIQTIGFAGFFGFAIEYLHPGDQGGEARCPALLSPAHRIRERGRSGPDAVARLTHREGRHTLFKRLRLSTIGAFPFVETIGHFFGLRLATDSLGWTRPQLDSRLFAARREGELEPDATPARERDGTTGLDLDARIALAEGMLVNMGLVKDFAPLVLLCGHGSRTTNNAYASGLDCGACGGYPGDVNATLAARVLNDPAVRKSLAERGIPIPEATRFVAGLHETTTDRVELLETEGADASILASLQDWLARAGRATRAERAPSLGLDARSGAQPDRRIFRRSRDWSEVRPEWGLAGNAALIAAPRTRTRSVDLGGRCFLHDYRAELDPEGRVLELILTAPLVVASWINLQYYASTVDNDVFGSGSKVLHNVVGRHGVMLGNGSDLRPGLPWQSVHDGERYVHEPIRLQAIIEAPLERIRRILAMHDDLRALVDHEWIHLIAVEPGEDRFHRWRDGSFETIGAGR